MNCSPRPLSRGWGGPPNSIRMNTYENGGEGGGDAVSFRHLKNNSVPVLPGRFVQTDSFTNYGLVGVVVGAGFAAGFVAAGAAPAFTGYAWSYNRMISCVTSDWFEA